MPKSNTQANASGPASETPKGPGTNSAADISASANQTTSFEKLLLVFKKTQAKSMEACLEAAKIALQHFHDHGNVSLLQRLHDAMDENFSRRAAFLKWAGENSPLAMENKLFLKDKSANARPFNLEKAFAQPFWEYSPAPKITFFTAEGIVEQIENMLNKYQKAATDTTSNSKPASEKVVSIISRLREVVTPLKADAIRADATGAAEKKAASEAKPEEKAA